MNLSRLMLIISGLCWGTGVIVLIGAVVLLNRLDMVISTIAPVGEFEQALSNLKSETAAAATQSLSADEFRRRLATPLARVKNGPLNWVSEQSEIESRVIDLYSKVPQHRKMRGTLDGFLSYLDQLSQRVADSKVAKEEEVNAIKRTLQQLLISGLLGLTAVAGCGFFWYFVKARSQNQAKADLMRDLATGAPSAVKAGGKDLESEIRTLSEMFEEQRRKIRLVLDNAVDVICLVGVDTKFQELNQAAFSSWGYKPEELIGKSLDDIILPEDRDKSLRSIVGAERSIAKVEFENRLKRKDGEVVHVLWSARWSASDNGLFCVAHDITARKMAEEMLRESEERVRLIIESLPICVLLTNDAGYIELVNAAGERNLSYSHEDLVGEHLSVLFGEAITTDDIVASLNRICQDVTPVRRRDETEFEAETAQAVLTVRGQNKRLILISDVTERQQADRLKRQFVAMISHDIKTPLTSLGVILELLLADSLGQLTPHGRTMVERALDESQRLVKLTKDLLDIEKMETGRFSLLYKKLSAQNLLKAAADSMQKLADVSTISIEVCDDDAVLEADKERLMQVLINLISNAIKFSTPRSKIMLGLEPNKELVRFTVQDFGRGIPEGSLESIFEKFKQIEVQDATEKGGTGLGLTICKAIIEQHGGRIGVDSKAGEGSKFWFELPYQPARVRLAGR